MSELLTRARAAWGEPLPDWIEALVAACDARGQTAVADEIGYSRPAVSRLVTASYGATDKIEAAIRTHLMRETVICPVLGEIEKPVCLTHQRRPYSGASPTRVAVFRACHGGCAHADFVKGHAS